MISTEGRKGSVFATRRGASASPTGEWVGWGKFEGVDELVLESV